MLNVYQQLRAISLIIAGFFLVISGFAQAPTISYVSQFTVDNGPVDIVNAGDGSNRLFIVEQNGIVVVRNGPDVTQFANFGATGANVITFGGEQGLLSMAFHPDYNGTTNRFFFIYYVNSGGNIEVARYQTKVGNRDTVEIGSATNIITIPHPGNTNHNGGKLNFGTDGYLYFATGDGGGGNDVPNNAQTGTVLLGKMLRLDINNTSAFGNYAVPVDNPYISDPAIDDRIWALGLRNPFRWSFDRLTGDMWIGDVGQGAFEEINFRAAGSTGHVNYGWRCFEGYESTPGVADCTPVDYVKPVYDYPNPGSGSSAVTGGFVYRGTEYPTFPGYYIAADVYSGQVFLLWPNGSGGFDSTVQNTSVSFVVAFGEAEDGTLYAASQADNTIYKVAASGGVVVPVALTSFTGLKNTGFNELTWRTSMEQNISAFHIEYSFDGSLYTRAGTVTASGNASGSSYNFRHYTDNKADILYKLVVENDNGSVSYSRIIRIDGSGTNIRVYPTVVTNGQLNMELNGRSLENVKVLNTNGMLMYKKDISNPSNIVRLQLPALAKGIYIVELSGDGTLQREKIVVQ